MEYHSSGCHSCWLGAWLCSTEKGCSGQATGRTRQGCCPCTAPAPCQSPQHSHALLLLGKGHPGAPDLSHSSKTHPQHPSLTALSGGKKKKILTLFLSLRLFLLPTEGSVSAKADGDTQRGSLCSGSSGPWLAQLPERGSPSSSCLADQRTVPVLVSNIKHGPNCLLTASDAISAVTDVTAAPALVSCQHLQWQCPKPSDYSDV